MMLKFSRSALAMATTGLVGIIAIGSAQAGTEVVSGTYGPAATDWSGATVRTISIPKFDTTLGTLTEVQVSVTSGVTGFLNITGITPSNTFVVGTGNSVNIESQMGVIDPFAAGALCDNTVGNCALLTGAVGVLATIGPGTYTANINNSGLSIIATSGDSYSTSAYGLVPFFATASTTNGGLSGSAYLSDFSGTGDIAYAIATNTALAGTFTAGTYTLDAGTSATAGLNVTYTYSPVTDAPEPASIAVLGAGLAALGARRRRKV